MNRTKKEMIGLLLSCIPCFFMQAGGYQRVRGRVVAPSARGRNRNQQMQSRRVQRVPVVQRETPGFYAAEEPEVAPASSKPTPLPALEPLKERPAFVEKVPEQSEPCMLTPEQVAQLSSEDRAAYLAELKKMFAAYGLVLAQPEKKEAATTTEPEAVAEQTKKPGLVQSGVSQAEYKKIVDPVSELHVGVKKLLTIIEPVKTATLTMNISSFMSGNRSAMSVVIRKMQAATKESKPEKREKFSAQQNKLFVDAVNAVDVSYQKLLFKFKDYFVAVNRKATSDKVKDIEAYLKYFEEINELYLTFLKLYSDVVSNAQEKWDAHQFTEVVSHASGSQEGSASGEHKEDEDQAFFEQLEIEVESNREKLQGHMADFTGQICMLLEKALKQNSFPRPNQTTRSTIDKKLEDFSAKKNPAFSKIMLTKEQYVQWAKKKGIKELSKQSREHVSTFESQATKMIDATSRAAREAVRQLWDIILALREKELEEKPSWWNFNINAGNLSSHEAKWKHLDKALNDIKTKLDKLKNNNLQTSEECVESIQNQIKERYNSFVDLYNELDQKLYDFRRSEWEKTSKWSKLDPRKWNPIGLKGWKPTYEGFTYQLKQKPYYNE